MIEQSITKEQAMAILSIYQAGERLIELTCSKRCKECGTRIWFLGDAIKRLEHKVVCFHCLKVQAFIDKD